MPCSRPPHVSLSDPPVLARIVPEHAMLWVVGVWATQTMPVSGLSKRRGRLSQMAALSVKTHVLLRPLCTLPSPVLMRPSGLTRRRFAKRDPAVCESSKISIGHMSRIFLIGRCGRGDSATTIEFTPQWFTFGLRTCPVIPSRSK